MSEKAERFAIELAGGPAISALRHAAHAEPRPLLFVYAPGAGSNLNDPFGVYLCTALASRGIEAWRFQFPYMEAEKRAPDPAAKLEACWRAVIGRAAGDSQGRLAVGGRSMGGRIASQVVASGVHADALVLLAYPLLPPGRSVAPRDAHFPQIEVPVLLCSGTRDSFATPAQLEASAKLIPRARHHRLDGADHGFGVLKSSGRTREEVWAEAAAAVLDFLGAVEKEGLA